MLQLLAPAERRVLWTQPLETPEFQGGYLSGHQSPTPLLLDLGDYGGEHEAVFMRSGEHGRLVVANDRYLAVAGRRSLVVLDPRDGQELWRRERLPTSARFAAGYESLYLLDDEAQTAQTIRLADGRVTESRDVAKWLKRSLAIQGDDLILLERSPGIRIFGRSTSRIWLRRWNPQTQAERYKLDYKPGTKVGLLEPGLAAVVEPTGPSAAAPRRLHLVELESGLQQTFSPVVLGGPRQPDQGLYVLADEQRVFLVANTDHEGNYHYGDSLQSIGVHGMVAAWDRTSGELLWRQPVTAQNLVMDRFGQSPVLLFFSRSWQEQGQANYTTLHLQMLSKATGRSLYDVKSPASYSGFHGVRLQEADQVLELTSYNQRLRLSPAR
jgi:hypothetical protein